MFQLTMRFYVGQWSDTMLSVTQMYHLPHAPDNTMATNTLKIIDLLTWSVYLAFHLQHLCKAGQYTSSFLFKIMYIIVQYNVYRGHRQTVCMCLNVYTGCMSSPSPVYEFICLLTEKCKNIWVDASSYGSMSCSTQRGLSFEREVIKSIQL